MKRYVVAAPSPALRSETTAIAEPRVYDDEAAAAKAQDKPMAAASVPDTHEPENPRPRSAPESVAVGSFLGLSGPAEESNDHSLDYLYEEEPQRHYGRLIFALLILAAFGVFIAYQWKQIGSWASAIIRPHTGETAAAAASATGDNAAGTAAASTDQSDSGSGSAAQNSSPAANGAKGESAPAPPVNAAPTPGNASTETPPPSEKPATSNSTKVPASGEGGTETAAPASPPATTPKEALPAAGRRTAKSAETEAPSGSAAPGDDLLAQGQSYLYGNHGIRSCEQAMIYLRKAADLGNPRARSQLGALYATGHCVPLDRVRAYQWYTLAADAGKGGSLWIDRNRQMLWNEMTAEEKAQARQSQ